MKFIFAALVFSLCLYLSACVSSPPRPEDWGNLAYNNTCPNIDGDYSNSGDGFNGTYLNPSIYGALMGGWWELVDQVKLVRITQKGESLLFDAYSDQGLMKTTMIKCRDKDCEQGFLECRYPKLVDYELNEEKVEYDYGAGGTVYEKSILFFSKAANGSLIVKHEISEFSAGYAPPYLIFPVFSSESVWYRFQLLNSDNNVGQPDN